MVKKLQKVSADKHASAQLSDTVKDSAQQIWLAGLGAFAKAQEEGGKVFEALVKEGLSIQHKTQAVAEEKMTEAASRMADMGSRATGKWDKLESIFEDRVARALNKLGVPSVKDVDALIVRIEDLHKSVQKLSAQSAAKAKPAAKPAVKRATVRKTARSS